MDGKSALSHTSALNSPSIHNSLAPPKKVKQEPMSPVKAHKSAVKQEHSLPAKKAVSFLLQILSEFFIKDFLLPFLRNVFYTRNQNMEHYCN